ncbi:MAG: hypothetical protein GY811_10560 [Myxococcales bacterium]|nr:hypothetical protein [Myxococcales bacterium]
MVKNRIAALLATAALSAGCGGAAFGGSVSVSASADINVPLAKMPAKYASWVVEADGYLSAVNDAYSRHTRATTALAGALGVEANADAIANFIRDAIQVESTLVCEPPSFKAGLVAECSASANARASGSAGNGGAHGAAAAGIKANCQAKASLSLSPGSCTLETTVTEHPILSNAAKWAIVESNMKIILQLRVANAFLDGRGAGINARGLDLHVESVTDLAKEPSLALQLNNIQAELKKGADATGKANDKQAAMNSDLRTMTRAISAQFPSLQAAINAG